MAHLKKDLTRDYHPNKVRTLFFSCRLDSSTLLLGPLHLRLHHPACTSTRTRQLPATSLDFRRQFLKDLDDFKVKNNFDF